MARSRSHSQSQADIDFPSLISDLTSLLLHSPAATATGPVFFSSSLSIPTPKPSPTPSPASAAPTPLARAAIGACAGAAAGAFTYAALLPIDAVKTRLQVQAATAPSATAWQVFLDILRTDGPLGLYRGLSAVILGSASSSAVYFGTCELAKSLLRPHLTATRGKRRQVMFALDGLRPAAQKRTRRASLLALLRICASAERRRVLRSQGSSFICFGK